MEQIELIKGNSKRKGTLYMEFSLGKYHGKFWQETSVFIEEETFALIEPVFKKNFPIFNHYNSNDIDRECWDRIVSGLEALHEQLGSGVEFADIVDVVGWIAHRSRAYFKENFQTCLAQLRKMISELVEWVGVNIQKHEYIAVLGI